MKRAAHLWKVVGECGFDALTMANVDSNGDQSAVIALGIDGRHIQAEDGVPPAGSSSFIGVSTPPELIESTRMPSGASSSAAALVTATTAAFDAE